MAKHQVIFNNGKNKHSKLGKMARTMADAPTMCPSECAFYDAGCYAQNGPTAIHGKRSLDFQVDIVEQVKQLPAGMPLRHFVSGDLFMGDEPNPAMINDVLESADHHDGVAYGYTHGWRRIDGALLNSKANLTYNASCETSEEVVEAFERGYDAVMVVPKGQPKVVEMPMFTQVLCPNLQNDNIKCSDCMLCAKKGRTRKGKRVVVCFEVHGAQQKKAAANVAAKQTPVNKMNELFS